MISHAFECVRVHRQTTGHAVEEISHFDTTDFSMFSVIR
jgi:hypothetical protein